MKMRLRGRSISAITTAAVLLLGCAELGCLVSAATPVIVSDTFESGYNLGPLNGQQGWTATADGGGFIEVSQDDTGAANKLIRINRPTTGTKASMSKSFADQSDDIVLKCRVYPGKTTDKINIYLDTSSSSASTIYMYFDGNGHLRYNDGTGNQDFSPAAYYTGGGWYDIEIHLVKENGSTTYNKAYYSVNGTRLYTASQSVRYIGRDNVKTMRFEVSSGGSEVFFDNIGVYSRTAPIVSDVSLAGAPKAGQTLEVAYSFYSDYGSADNSSLSWQISDTLNGNYTSIIGMNGKTFTPILSDVGKYVRCEITPIDSGGMTGIPQYTPPVLIVQPDKHLFDFNADTAGQPPSGWTTLGVPANGSAAVAEFPDSQNKSVQLIRTGSSNVSLSLTFMPIADVCSVQVSVYAPTESPRLNIYFYGSNMSQIPCQLQFYQGKIQYRDSSGFVDIAPFEVGKWQTVKAVIYFVEKKVDLYINGVRTRSGLSMRSDSIDLSSVKLDMQQQATAYIDNLQINQEIFKMHPQLNINSDGIRTVNRNILSSQDYGAFWSRFKDAADAVKTPPAAYSGGDTRSHGEGLVNLSFAHLVTGDKSYYDRAEKWALLIATYPQEVYQDKLDGAHHLYAMSAFYDWCYDTMPSEVRTTIKNAIVTGASTMYTWLTDPDNTNSSIYLCNQLHLRLTALAASALVLSHEVAQADAWLQYAVDKYNTVFDILASDGASIEGVGYGQYSLQFMMLYLDFARTLIGIDYFSSEWLRNNAFYQLYMTTPKNSWGSNSMNVDIGDSPRYNWYGPDYFLYRYAKEYGNPYAQWLAKAIDIGGYSAPDMPFLNLLWYDPSVLERSPSDLPTLRQFDNVGLVVARSDWSGDEALLTFTCGPGLGLKGTENYSINLGDGHIHPNANSFSIFANGQWLVPNAGYMQRRTAYENTLLVDGKGQLDQSSTATWWDLSSQYKNAQKLIPQIEKAQSSPDFDYITGDATPNYPGLTKFKRHIIFIKPDIVIVCDDIAASDSKDYELQFHLEGDSTSVTQDAGAYIYSGDTAKLKFRNISGATVSGQGQQILNRSGQVADTRFLISNKSSGKSWKNVAVFSWSDKDAVPRDVEYSQTGDTWRFVSGGKAYAFDWEDCTASDVLVAEGSINSNAVIEGSLNIRNNGVRPYNLTGFLVLYDMAGKVIGLNYKTRLVNPGEQWAEDFCLNKALASGSKARLIVWKDKMQPVYIVSTS